MGISSFFVAAMNERQLAEALADGGLVGMWSFLIEYGSKLEQDGLPTEDIMALVNELEGSRND